MQPDQPAYAPPEARQAAAEAFEAAHARTLDQGQITAAIADAVWQVAYQRGFTEGRRQATEGWGHAGWLALLHDTDGTWGNSWDGHVHTDRAAAEQAVAEANAAGWETVLAEVRRLVGPWEPAEQPEPDPPKPLAPRTLGDCPRCGKPFTGYSAEPYQELWDLGYREVIAVAATYLPCGCTHIRAVDKQPEGGTR